MTLTERNTGPLLIATLIYDPWADQKSTGKIYKLLKIILVLSRLKVTFSSNRTILSSKMDRHYIQSYIYSCLSDKGDTHFHTGNHFRHFSFAPPFPSGDLVPGTVKDIIISSPDDDMISKLKEAVNERGEIWFGQERAGIENIKTYHLKVPEVFQTGSPIVLYKNNRENIYYSLRNGDSLSQILKRMKENIVKRYKDFTGDRDFEFNRTLFDNIVFQKEVATPVTKGNSTFTIIGTTYYRMERLRISNRESDMYRYMLESGLGEKTSFGFGLLNPVRRGN